MSLLDTASLIVTPNKYEEGKLYSVIPSDGSGDLSVTRATTATRVNSAGLVELVPYNLLRYSQEFNNAVWVKYAAGTGVNPIITPNSTTAPDGTLTADTIVLNAGASATPSDQSQLYQSISVTTGTTYTLSFYAKGVTGGEQIMVRHAGSSAYTKITLTTEWVRYTTTETSPLNTAEVVFLIRRGLLEPINASATFYLWGAQIVEGSTAKDYQKTETRLNIPRLDYSNGTCPSLLVEPQRTNISYLSNQFNSWNSKVNVTTTSAYTTSPEGIQNATRLQFTSSGFMYNYPSFQQVSGTTYTLSCWVKRNGTGTQSVGFFVNGTGGINSAWTITSEWQRVTYTYTAANNNSVGISGASGADVSVYGWQFEAGSYATSYIPTTSASVTRNADVISKTGISSLIGQTEGTIFFELETTKNLYAYMGVDDTTANTRIIFYGTGDNKIYAQMKSGGTTIFSAGSSTISGKVKAAVAFNSSNSVFYVNGVQVNSATGSTFSSLSQLTFNHASQYGAKVNTAVLWKTRLTNDQLATLTTL